MINVLVVSYSLLLGLLWFILPSPILVIIGALAPIAALVVLQRPYLVCLGFIIFSFFRIHEAFPVLSPIKIPQLLAIASLGVLSWHLFITRTIEVYWSKQLSWFCLFFGLVVLGLVMASNRGQAMAYFNSTYIKITVMVFAIVWLSRKPTDFLLAARLLTLAGILVAAVALFNKVNGIGLVEGTRVTIGRDIGSILGDPNDLSLVLLFPCSFALGLFFADGLSKFERNIALLAFIFLVSAIIATQSRGGLLGIMAVMGYFAWQKVQSKALLVSAAVCLLPILFVAAGISDRSSGGAAEEGIDESAMGRIYAWQAAFNMALVNPVTGVGIDNFYANYFFYSPHWDGLNHAVHSTWFGILAETGFVGLTVFICLLVSLFKALFNANKQLLKINASSIHPIIQPCLYAITAGLLSFMVSGTFLTQGFTWPFYVLMAMAVAVCEYVKRLLKQETSTTSP